MAEQEWENRSMQTGKLQFMRDINLIEVDLIDLDAPFFELRFRYPHWEGSGDKGSSSM